MTNPRELMARLKGSQAQMEQPPKETPKPPPFMQQQAQQTQAQQQTLTAPPLGLGQTSVTQQLQEIGDQQGVNPPQTPIGAPPEQPPAQKTDAGKSECPHCKKDFIRLGGHIKKCPVRLSQEAQDQVVQNQVAQNEVPATEEPFLPETTPQVQAQKDVQNWQNQGQEPTVTPNAGRLAVIIGAVIQKAEVDLTYIDFQQFIKPLCDQMTTDQNILYWNQLEFGKAGPMLAFYLDDHLKNLNSPNGLTIVVSDITSAEYRACSGALQRYASKIIRGI